MERTLPCSSASSTPRARGRAWWASISRAGQPRRRRFDSPTTRLRFAARDLGLGRTVHAGEGRPPDELRVAIEQLHAQRIGHGTTLLDDLRVLDLVVERGVTLEACPTSNVHTGVIRAFSEHPLVRWLSLGVKACVCADNSLLSDVSTAQEYERASTLPGMTAALLANAVANGHAARFVRG